MKRFFASLWGVVATFGRLLAQFFTIIGLFTKKYVNDVLHFTDPNAVGEEGKRLWVQNWFMQWSVRIFLLMFTPLVLIIIPVGIAVTVAAIMISIDQALWPDHAINTRFADYGATTLTREEKGVLLIDATVSRLDEELNSTLGWAPNDVMGGQFLDNRVNCQLGTLNTTRELLRVLTSEISRFSNVDEVNPLLLEASKEIAYRPDNWIFPESESAFLHSLELVSGYTKCVRAGGANCKVNVTTQDITTILDAIIVALSEPRGRVTGSGHVVPWNELDDRVYYAACSAAVARDVFSALWVGFHAEMEKGAEENVVQAINSLDKAARYNPWWVSRGDGDSKMADDRSKVARYMTEAIELIGVVRNSIKN